jgi:GDPmannose 4,6-dehydratase
MSKKALIVGVSGQDGSYLARLLLDKGYTVYGTSRDAAACAFTGLKRLGIYGHVHLISMSTREFQSVFQTLKNIKPDEVYNLAGQTSVGLSFDQPAETFESITIGVLNLLETIRSLGGGIKLYNAASSECFGNMKGFSADETTAFSPLSPYAVAKCAAFWQVANYRTAYNIFACSGIMFNHESVLRHDRFVTQKIIRGAKLISLGKLDKLALGTLTIERDWGWAPEYVEAMWLMLQSQNPEDFVIGTGTSHTLQHFVESSFSYVNLDYRDYLVFESKFCRPNEISVSRSNPTKAKNLLGWEAKVNLDQVIAYMFEGLIL